jgi:HEAT repeat protein
MLADAFEALKTFDWGTDLALLAPIDDAVAASRSGAETTQELEQRLVAALNESLSRDAKDYLCRKLAVVGTANAVPALAVLLPQKDHSHMARFALERIPAAEATKALSDSLEKVSGNLKIGIIGSLGARRDQEAIKQLGTLLNDQDAAVARASAQALGTIGTAESAAVLQASLHKASGDQQAVIDALLTCADALLASGNGADATAIFQSLSSDKHGRLVRLAATRGLLACGAAAQ